MVGVLAPPPCAADAAVLIEFRDVCSGDEKMSSSVKLRDDDSDGSWDDENDDRGKEPSDTMDDDDHVISLLP